MNPLVLTNGGEGGVQQRVGFLHPVYRGADHLSSEVTYLSWTEFLENIRVSKSLAVERLDRTAVYPFEGWVVEFRLMISEQDTRA